MPAHLRSRRTAGELLSSRSGSTAAGVLDARRSELGLRLTVPEGAEMLEASRRGIGA
ncbi:MAG: hypothetical protein ACRCXL_01685 [Dermatophilaceae bacterium]